MKYDISFDFEKNEVDTTRGGNLSLISGKTALIGRIQKVLRTAKNRFDVYFDSGFGNDTERCLIGKSYPQTYVTAEVERIVKECVGGLDGVNDIGSFSVRRDGARLEIEFTADTIYGSERISVSD